MTLEHASANSLSTTFWNLQLVFQDALEGKLTFLEICLCEYTREMIYFSIKLA